MQPLAEMFEEGAPEGFVVERLRAVRDWFIAGCPGDDGGDLPEHEARQDEDNELERPMNGADPSPIRDATWLADLAARFPDRIDGWRRQLLDAANGDRAVAELWLVEAAAHVSVLALGTPARTPVYLRSRCGRDVRGPARRCPGARCGEAVRVDDDWSVVNSHVILPLRLGELPPTALAGDDTVDLFTPSSAAASGSVRALPEEPSEILGRFHPDPPMSEIRAHK